MLPEECKKDIFRATDVIVVDRGFQGETVISVDRRNRLVRFPASITERIVDYSDILSSRIDVDCIGLEVVLNRPEKPLLKISCGTLDMAKEAHVLLADIISSAEDSTPKNGANAQINQCGNTKTANDRRDHVPLGDIVRSAEDSRPKIGANAQLNKSGNTKGANDTFGNAEELKRSLQRKLDKMEAFRRSKPDYKEKLFRPSRSFVTQENLIFADIAIAFDDTNRLVKFPTNPKDIYVSFGDILSSEIYQEGKSITKTSVSSQVIRGTIGALTLGGVGAIIGGLSGKRETEEYTEYVCLNIVVNDAKNPLLTVPCGSIERAQECHALISVIIKNVEKTNQYQDRDISNRSSRPQSVADELIKLKSLLDSGVLTEAEFNQQKNKLLG